MTAGDAELRFVWRLALRASQLRGFEGVYFALRNRLAAMTGRSKRELDLALLW